MENFGEFGELRYWSLKFYPPNFNLKHVIVTESIVKMAAGILKSILNQLNLPGTPQGWPSQGFTEREGTIKGN